MKHLFTILSLLFICSIYAQREEFDRYVGRDRFQDFKGEVRSLTVNVLDISLYRDVPDTLVFVDRTVYSPTKIPTSRYFYRKNTDEEPWQVLTFDHKGRKVHLIRKDDNNKIVTVINQFFRDNQKYSDSLVILDKEFGRTEIWRNHFRDSLVVRQDLFTNDTLRKYYLYDYDALGRVIKELRVNTKNGFGITLGSGITGGKPEKYINPNDSILYAYESRGDTIVTKEFKKGRLTNIEKRTTTENFEYVHNEIYNSWGLFRLYESFTYPDSVISKWYYLTEGDTTKIVIAKQSQLGSESSTYYSEKPSEPSLLLTKKTWVYDDIGNWVLREEKSKSHLRIITREIEYYGE